jgi:hypothetical protein
MERWRAHPVLMRRVTFRQRRQTWKKSNGRLDHNGPESLNVYKMSKMRLIDKHFVQNIHM